MRIRFELYYSNADPDPGSQTKGDPCGSGSDFNVLKLDFFSKVQVFLKADKQDYYLILINFYIFKLLDLDPHPDPGKSNQCGSGSTKL
jgi:hypothetical protein